MGLEWKVLTDRNLAQLESALNDGYNLIQVATTEKQVVYILNRPRMAVASKKK